MEITVLSVPGCPNLTLLSERLAPLLKDRPDVHVIYRTVEQLEQAQAWGMTGSPTLLINGRDPFAEPGHTASLSCRLYRTETGSLEGAPSTEQLRQALER